ncbi:MAG TPA: ABC transporter substrate-binding protein, partial [Bradyrhizobium sp.]|nr:ABC transporter substrate-binding protein [Bradyrhizobium sp.]
TYDVEKRRLLMAKIEAIMQDDGPILQPFWANSSTVMSKRVKGFKMHPSYYLHLQEIGIEKA